MSKSVHKRAYENHRKIKCKIYNLHHEQETAKNERGITMKKILAFVLSFCLAFGLGASALAVSWAAPAVSSTASPFGIEVIKLTASSDVTGAAYYTVLDEAAAYDYSTIYYAIKLSLPSVADANAYYGNSGFVTDNQVKVTITWNNVSGKSTKTLYVPISSEAQTLWYDGTNFTAVWQQTLNVSCGCGESHIQSALASGTNEVSIKACVGASGVLSDISIGGCYSVVEKTFKGVIPCVNCTPQNLSGYLFSGDCAANDVFFSTNSANRVTGVYVMDKYLYDLYYGAVENAYTESLYAWRVSGSYTTNCYGGSCTSRPSFSLQQLSAYALLDETGGTLQLSDGYAQNLSWFQNGTSYTSSAFAQWLSDGMASSISISPSVSANDWMQVYTLKNGVYTKVNKQYVSGKSAYAASYYAGLTSSGTVTISVSSTTSGGVVSGSYSSYTTVSGSTKDIFTGYPYVTQQYIYGDTKIVADAAVDNRLFQQTSATTVNCDTNEASYLNTLNHLYSLLGFTYADVAAGNVYMNEDILLANFGFSTSVCDTATWSAYTAAITVSPVTEVPATGQMSFVGFICLGLGLMLAAWHKKMRAWV